jgi:hypothetical protein
MIHRSAVAYVSFLVLLMLCTVCGCDPVKDYADDPVLARSQAEMAGSLTVFAFFTASADARKHADEVGVAITAIHSVIKGFPAEGFMSLYPKVDEILKATNAGTNVTFLPASELLAQTVLQALQHQAEVHKWADKAEAVTDIVASFLTGADNALATFRLKPVTP